MKVKKTPLSFRVVGVGASAGGLDAFKQLLRSLPNNTGMAFVLIQHLDPGHKSMLRDILSRETTMPVYEVTDGMRIEPDHVYVIPPNAQMSIRAGVLNLTPRGESHATKPIDFFLRSLAADRGARAIAIILSGADSDGAEALQGIKAEGGIVFAQDPSHAKFDAMPRAAVETGQVDFILPTEQIGRELGRLSGGAAVFLPRGVEPGELPPEALSECHEIYALLRKAHGVDFTHYKQSTLRRRIQRRMLARRARTLKAYTKILQDHPEEVGTLYADLLIHVTQFFRDPEVFTTLKKKVFPFLFKNRASTDPIRIWVPGCSTGEEAYSIAICLQEYFGKHAAQTPIKIFATDISETALQKARLGIYSAQSMRNVSLERRRHFFSPLAHTFQIHKSIRDCCVFSKQDVTHDPPFSRLDLISCRNLLIYLGAVLQKDVLSIFNYALKPNGLLQLGKSESIGVFSDLFEQWDHKMKIYSRATIENRPPSFSTTVPYSVEALTSHQTERADDGGNLSIQKEADQYVLGKRSPAGVIVDRGMNIVQFRGAISQYLELASGTATFHLFKLAKEGLLLELRSAILEAKKKNAPVKHPDSRVKSDGIYKNVTIEVVPLRNASVNAPYFLVLFHDASPDVLLEGQAMRTESGRKRNTVSQASLMDNSRLKKELAATKDYLQSVIDEHERINEELKSANEEALSSNEEYQSTNEELETAKEELQATNEETSTLNEDLHNRNIELNRLNDDLVNLMNSVNTPTVILGRDHHIRRVSAAAERVLNLSRTDIGRSIHELKLTISVLDLKNLVNQVLNNLVLQKREIQDLEGHWYLLRIQPYKTTDGVTDGVVLTFSDIQAAKEHQATAEAWTEDLERRVKERTEELAKSQSALLQSEKLEAVGRLAGGVAHDFNNLMTGILGMSQDVLEGLGKDSPYHDDLQEVIGAAKKAMVVTKQLLAFGRRQVFDPRVLNINNVIGGMDKLLQRLLGEDIVLTAVLDPRLGNVNIDQSSIEQVILNLALNARDSMPKGGRITLLTSNTVVLDEHAAIDLEVPPGPYVVMTVTDEGSGMSPEILSHIFEPFFTTKGEEKGTGLGLATVYGIIKQSGGGISVNSVIGKGTSFSIYLPRLGSVSANEKSPQLSQESLGGSETILVAEDEDIVRKVVIRALQKKGYTVLDAQSGAEALTISQKHTAPIHLLLTDVIMPGMNGQELAKAIMNKRPTLSVLYMSGHDKRIIAQRGILDPGTDFIEKSFTAEALCQKVRDVLDAALLKEPHV